jgi:hypothetical protein
MMVSEIINKAMKQDAPLNFRIVSHPLIALHIIGDELPDHYGSIFKRQYGMG